MVSQQIPHFYHTPFSLHPSLPPDTGISAAALFFWFFHSHPVVSLQLECSLPLSNTCKCFCSRLADAVASDDQRGWPFWPTYLSVLLQIRFISYEDHGKFISVFYPQDLSLEFVDFLKAVKPNKPKKKKSQERITAPTSIKENPNITCASILNMLETAVPRVAQLLRC